MLKYIIIIININDAENIISNVNHHIGAIWGNKDYLLKMILIWQINVIF